MTMEQIWTLLRQLLLFAGGILVGKGYIDSATLETLVGAAVTIATALFGLWKRSPAQIIETAASLPEVERVVAPEVAAQTKTPNVTAS